LSLVVNPLRIDTVEKTLIKRSAFSSGVVRGPAEKVDNEAMLKALNQITADNIWANTERQVARGESKVPQVRQIKFEPVASGNYSLKTHHFVSAKGNGSFMDGYR